MNFTDITFKDVFDTAIKLIVTTGVIWIGTGVYQTKSEFATFRAITDERIEANRQMIINLDADAEQSHLAILALITENKSDISEIKEKYAGLKGWLEAVLPKNEFKITEEKK